MVQAQLDLSSLDWSARMASQLEETSVAVGRLDALVSMTSVRRTWLDQASWVGFTSACRAQGDELDEIDIFGLAMDSPLPRRQSIAFAADKLDELRRWQAEVGQASAPHWRELIPVTLDLPSDWGERPALLRALQLVALHARADPSAAPWLGLPALLRALGVTRTALPCLVAADKALRLTVGGREAIVLRYLKALSSAAEIGRERLAGAEADRKRAASAVARAHRPGKLVVLSAMMQRRPLLAPLFVARALKVTISGAGKLLARAADEGLVVEISGKQAWRAYLTQALAIAYGYRQRPIGRPPALADPGPLGPVLARFDAEQAAIEAQLTALGVSMPPKASD